MKELWSELNSDLLEEIAGRLDSYDDYLHLRAVCVSWRSALPGKPSYLRCQLPLLLLPPVEKTGSRYGLFSLSEKKVYTLDSLSPVAGGCMPKTAAWSSQQIRRGFLYKIVLSTDQCTAMAIRGELCKLAFCRLGDQRWTLIACTETKHYEDIIFCKGKFFAVRCDWRVIACDFNTGSSPIVTQISPPCPCPSNFGSKMYLVESAGEILLIDRRLMLQFSGMPEVFLYSTVRFRVFKLEQDQMSWSQLRNIGDQALFLGFNSSLSFSSRDFPELKGNHIYFSDDKHCCHTRGIIGGFDVGIYDLEKDFIEPLPEPLPSYMGNSQQVWPPPIWFTPNLID